ncbi:MAG: hypothetical protein V7724_06175 [Sediminicola sp.]
MIWYFSSNYWWKYFILPLTSLFFYFVLQNFGLVPSHYLHEMDIVDLVSLLLIGSGIFLFDFMVSRKNIHNPVRYDLIYNGNPKNHFKSHIAYYEGIKSQGWEGNLEIYLKKLYSLETSIQEWIERSTGIADEPSLVARRLFEGFVILLLLYMPIFRYQVGAMEDGIKEITFAGIRIGSHGFLNVKVLMWFISAKIMTLIPLCIWYVTCHHWWKYAILSPIILYAFQIWEAFQDNDILDAYGNIRAFPAVFVVVSLVVSLSIAVRYRSKILDFHQDIKLEIEALLGKMEGSNNILAHQQKTFRELQDTKVDTENAQNHLQSLLKLREELLRELDQKK